jgi:hypothetical protein
MSAIPIVIIGIVVVAGVSTVGILHARKKKTKKDKNSTGMSFDSFQTDPINPRPFKTGYLKNPHQKLANLCASKNIQTKNILYPVQPRYVEYDLSDDNTQCDINLFNARP